MGHEMNADQTRAITDEGVFGFPGYEGKVEDGTFEGRHAGVFDSIEEARKWLAGDPSVEPLKVYEDKR